MNWGEFIAFMFIPDLIELITKQMEVFTWATRWSLPACHIMRSFVSKYFNPNRFRVVFQFRQGHVRNVLMDEEHHSATMKVSVLPKYVVRTCFREKFRSCLAIELSIFVSWIVTIWGLWTSRKANKSNFLPLILFIFKLMNFNPPREFVWFVRFDEIPSFFLFVRGSNLFRFIRFNWSTKKESEKLKNSHFGQIHVQPDFNTFSYSASVMNAHSLWIHISQPSHWWLRDVDSQWMLIKIKDKKNLCRWI